MNNFFSNIALICFLIILPITQVLSQCIQEGYKTEATINTSAGSLLNPNFSTEVVVGQTLISDPYYSYTGTQKYISSAGYWTYMYNPPIIANVAASDGVHEDRIEISWSINKNTPAVNGGFNVYRDGFLIGSTNSNVFSFIDNSITPGIYYTYAVTGINSQGEGAKTEDLGYVNPNGVVSGRITTFSGSSVEGAIVSLTPDNNLSLRFNGTGGLFVDTIGSNPNPLIDSAFTLSMWTKVNSFASDGMLFDYGKQDDVNFWMGVESDSSIYIAMADASGTKKVSYQLTEKYNLWHHIAGQYNGRDLILFFDGAIVSSTTLNFANNKYADHKIAMGSLTESHLSTNKLFGHIDEVRLINRVQRPSEIKKFMNYTVPTNFDGLVGYWKMNEGKGDRVINQVEKERTSILCSGNFSTTEPGIKIAGISNTSGYYLIEGVNYGSGTSFTVTPEKFVSYNTALEFNDIENNYAVTSDFRLEDSSTVELWFSPYHYNGTQYILSADGGTPFDIYLSGNSLMLNINGEVQAIATLSGIGYKYLSLVKEGGTITARIDGDVASQQVLNYSYSTIIPSTTWNLGRSNAGANYYAGLIDAVVAFNDPLSISEIQLHHSFGLMDRMTEEAGLAVVDERINAFIHLNDQEGTEIVNDVPVNGMLQYGSVSGAQFVDVVAHESGIDHEFNPNSRIVTLNNSNTSADQIDFVDITTVPLTGIIKYENSKCFIEFAEILLDGQTTSPPTFTNSDGQWLLEMEPGASGQISARFQSHQMFPTPFFEVKNVQSPIAGITFLDQEKRTISGVVAGGMCQYGILGTGKTMTISLNATTGCYSDEIVLDENSSVEYVFSNVPPGEYTVGVTHSDGVFPASIGEFFSNLGAQTIDVLNEDADSINFVYRSGHNLEISQLDTNTCGDVLLIQSLPVSVSIKVYEDYLGQRCYLDQADLAITDGIGESTDPGFTGTTTMQGGEFTYTFAPGEANIVSPYLKGMQVIATVDGVDVSENINAVVLGKKKRSTTFTTTTPEMPMTVLRDPPGDQSYAFLTTNQEVCMTNMNFKYKGLGVGFNASVSLGADVTTSFGIGAETELEVDVTAEFGYSANLSSDGTVTNEVTQCVSFEEILETTPIAEDKEGSFALGEDADIYLGAAVNLEYGLTDILSYNDTICGYELSTELMIDPVGFNTFYIYTQHHLENDVIPSNYLLGDTASAEAWENFIVLNQTYKDQALFKENRSFDAGVVYSTSSTTSKSETVTQEFSMNIDQSIYLAAGIEVNGIGVSFSENIDISMSYGGAITNGSTKSQTVGYTLADDDLGDNFTVNIYEDKHFGTPVFKLVSGESSCPHEENTLPREGVQILVDNLKVSTKVNVSTDESAIFNLYLGNTSQSSETMTYVVNLVNGSNPLGAVLSINGNVLGTDGLEYQLDANLGQFVTLALDRGADPNIFDYDSIQVVFQSLCDDQITDTVMVNAHFVEPCSSVDISAPMDGWVITPVDNGTLSIVLNGYDESDPDLELIRIQYRETGTGTWINVDEILTSNLGAVTTQSDWNIGALQDGNYELRALSQCAGGLPAGYADLVSGIIEQQSPEIIGIPQPADGILNAGDEISVTFSELINCENIIQADQYDLNNIGLFNLTTNSLVNANIQCVGDKITITPLIPSIYMENNTLEVRIQKIEDLVGNQLGLNITGDSVHKWDFYVNVSPVGWIGSDINEVASLGTLHTFTRIIENTGGTNVNYTIQSPSYITPSSASGILAAGAQQTITFTVDQQLSSGDYTDEIVLNSSYGNEVLPMQLRVMCPPPNWSVNATQFAANMNFSVSLDIEGFPSEDQYDVIAGFIDGQVRGIANVQYVDALDKHLAFLSVYGDAADNGKNITFKIWDASECKLYDQTMESYPFAINGQAGTPLNEDVIHTIDLLARMMYLNQGWNWVSFNLDLANDNTTDVLSGLSYPDNSLIKSQTQFSQYYPATESWAGDLLQINEYEMYQIKLDADDSLEFYGKPVDVDSTPISLEIGWNWISYLPQGGMTPDHAFQVLEPLNGDLVKNQYYFAQYIAGYGWIGNLTYMNAPSGYLYNSSVADTLIYPIDANSIVGKSAESQLLQAHTDDEMFSIYDYVNLNPTQFKNNMNVVGVGLDGNLEITDPEDMIYAYIDGEVRGVTKGIFVEPAEKSMLFLTIYANDQDSGKEITFKYLDASEGTLYDVDEVLEFLPNAMLGIVNEEQPFTLGMEKATGTSDIESMTTNSLSVHPNPFKHSSTISIYGNSGDDIHLNVYDNVGKLIASKDIKGITGKVQLDFNDLVSPSSQIKGIYHINAIVGDKVISRRLIKQ